MRVQPPAHLDCTPTQYCGTFSSTQIFAILGQGAPSSEVPNVLTSWTLLSKYRHVPAQPPIGVYQSEIGSTQSPSHPTLVLRPTQVGN